jgi:KUP system potassium uptake protein
VTTTSAAPPHATTGTHQSPQQGHSLRALVVASIGIVFGDIGTSPLYTLKECVHGVVADGARRQPDDVLQVLSMVFWALMLVVTLKYVVFVMRVHNRGEGGIFALLALLPERVRKTTKGTLTVLTVVVVVGAALLYGDGVITPAISVLSAVEGLRIAVPSLDVRVILAITVAILVGLFAIQSRGTNTIGKLFGPVMCLWFATIGALGLWQIVLEASVLRALSPTYALAYFAAHGVSGLPILGSVVLAVTGGEALYADMGHFGAKPIRVAWLFIALPTLVLNYFGQGALYIREPAFDDNAFFAMVPIGAATIALVVLSGVATVIASQALISGAYSLTRQSMQLGLFPRVDVVQTAEEHQGQIYIPEVRNALAVGSIALVLLFQESSKLADAFGLAVTGTMTITSIVFFAVLITHLRWPLWKALPLFALFLVVDLPFLTANSLKFFTGGYVPIAIAAVLVVVMLVWYRGRRLLVDMYGGQVAFDETWPELQHLITQRTPGTAVFLTSTATGLPPILTHYVRGARALHKRVILLNVVTADEPWVKAEERLALEELGHGFFRVVCRFGFMQTPDLPRALRLAAKTTALDVDLDDVTWFLTRERILGGKGGRMGATVEGLFAYLHRNAANADRYFHIPPERVMELGQQIDL